MTSRAAAKATAAAWTTTGRDMADGGASTVVEISSVRAGPRMAVAGLSLAVSPHATTFRRPPPSELRPRVFRTRQISLMTLHNTRNTTAELKVACICFAYFVKKFYSSALSGPARLPY